MRELLEDYVPELRPIIASRDLKAAQMISMSFITKDLRALESDIIWKVPGHERPDCFIYVLIEHQSTPKPRMALRILRYMTALYSRLDKQQKDQAQKDKNLNETDNLHANPRLLPYVFPIVLYCGERPWQAPHTFAALVEKPLPDYTPKINAQYFLINVTKLNAEMLRKARNAMAGLFLLEKARLSEQKEYFDQAMQCLGEEKDRDLIEVVLLTGYNILKARNKPKEAEKIKKSYLQLKQEKNVMALTMREFLAKIGREEGLTEGFEKGRQEGIEKGFEKGRQEGIEKGIEEGRMESFAALCKAFTKRGIPFEDYQSDLQKLPTVAAIGDLIVDFMAAEAPKTFLKERFGR